MSNNNSMQIIGNLVDDPTLRYTNREHKPVVNFRVASDEQIQVDGEWQSRATFMNVVAFSQLADNVSDLTKGTRVVVIGRVRTREIPQEAGAPRVFFTEIVADEVAASLKWASVEVTRNAPKDGQPLANVGSHQDPVYGEEEAF